MSEVYAILDLQFGSTGKGLLAGYLAKTRKPDVVVTAWGPNAGHTYIDENRTYIHRMLANGVVSPNLRAVLIGPGSVIDLDVLWNEIHDCKDLLDGKHIIIHPHAVVVNNNHREAEQKFVKIGSTMKGTGAAVIQRIMRDPDDMNIAKWSIPKEFLDKVFELNINLDVSDYEYRFFLDTANKVQVEGAQGFSLSMYHGFYPYCTSRDVTIHQVLADCAIPALYDEVEVIGTLRTFPIRVANRYNDRGDEIGNSGPCYDDQEELSWEDLGLDPELTTVTQLPRRIFNFSYEQLTQAIRMNKPSKLFLNFANYMKPSDLSEMIDEIELHGVRIEWLGYGPSHEDVKNLQYIEPGVHVEEE